MQALSNDVFTFTLACPPSLEELQRLGKHAMPYERVEHAAQLDTVWRDALHLHDLVPQCLAIQVAHGNDVKE